MIGWPWDVELDYDYEYSEANVTEEVKDAMTQKDPKLSVFEYDKETNISRARMFAYGTLKSSFANHRALHESTFVGMGVLKDHVMVDMGPYPAICPIEEGGWVVHGEVYLVDFKTLDVLDNIEGHPVFYQRVEVNLDYHGKVYTYIRPRRIILHEGAPFVPSGRWLGPETVTFQWSDRMRVGNPLLAVKKRSIITMGGASDEHKPSPGPLYLPPPARQAPVVVSTPLQVGPGWEEA